MRLAPRVTVALCVAHVALGCTSPQSEPPWRFDTAFVDQGTGTLLLADATNHGVDVFDTKSGAFQGTISLPTSPSGVTPVPSGVLVANGTIIASGTDSNVYFFDARFRTSIGPPLSTGGKARADALQYDPYDDLLLVVNGSETPALLTLISLTGQIVVAQISLLNVQSPDQPIWDPATKVFYVPVGASVANPFGEVDVVDPRSRAVVGIIPLPVDCQPAGMALGPNDDAVLGCNVPQRSLILNLVTKQVVTIPQVGGSDEVWYDPSDKRYYLAAYLMTKDRTNLGQVTPVIGIIDAATNTWIKNIPIAPDENPNIEEPHSIAVDATDNRVFLPTAYLGLLTFDSP
jgi:hypothetical protein